MRLLTTIATAIALISGAFVADAAAQWNEKTKQIEGVIDGMGNGGAALHRVSVGLKGQHAELHVEPVSLRYKIGMLWNEPVWSWDAKYELRAGPGVKFYRDGNVWLWVTVGAGLAKNTVNVVNSTFESTTVQVSRDVFDLIRITDFRFRLKLRSDGGPRQDVAIEMHTPGVLDEPGKWGWDVSGSPDWKRLFINIRRARPGATRRQDPGGWLGESEAKAAWRAMIQDAKANPTRSVFENPMIGLGTWDYSVNFWGLWGRIRLAAPHAFRNQFEGAQNKQAGAMIAAVARDQVTFLKPDGLVRSDKEMQRLRDLTRRVLQQNPSVAPEFRAEWRRLANPEANREAAKRARELAAELISAGRGSSRPTKLPYYLKSRIESVEALLKDPKGKLTAATREQIKRALALVPGNAIKDEVAAIHTAIAKSGVIKFHLNPGTRKQTPVEWRFAVKPEEGGRFELLVTDHRQTRYDPGKGRVVDYGYRYERKVQFNPIGPTPRLEKVWMAHGVRMTSIKFSERTDVYMTEIKRDGERTEYTTTEHAPISVPLDLANAIVALCEKAKAK